MADPVMDTFDQLPDEEPVKRTYPGTNTPIPDSPPPFDPGDEDEPWDADPHMQKWLRLAPGEPAVEMFLMGALALALNRKPVTLRLWERKGYLPTARYRTPSNGAPAGKRLYTRAQVEGLRGIAREEGLLTAQKSPANTQFPVRAKRLFAYLHSNNIF